MAKKYDKHTKKSNKLKGKIKSGVQSGDSKAELIIAEPLQEHPEISGLYRAFDPDTGWKGWVEYSLPPTSPKAKTPKELKREKYTELLGEYAEKKHLVDQGIFAESELEMATIKAQIKVLYNELNS